MKSEFSNQQSDWLNQIEQLEELNDTEASQVKGGTAEGISALAVEATQLFSAVKESALEYEMRVAIPKLAKDKAKALTT